MSSDNLVILAWKATASQVAGGLSESLHKKGMALADEIGTTPSVPTLPGIANSCVSGRVFVPEIQSPDSGALVLLSLSILVSLSARSPQHTSIPYLPLYPRCLRPRDA